MNFLTPTSHFLQKLYLPGSAMACLLAALAPCASFAESGEVYITNTQQDYDGAFKFPLISTDPPGLGVSVKIFPRSQSTVVFESNPAIAQPSYSSYGIDGKIDKALGNILTLEPGNRRLESIDVTMVNWAAASQWPVLAAANPAGYFHPISVFVYGISGENLTLLGQETQSFLVPWKRSTLADRGKYPFGGVSFKARFDFVEEIELTDNIAVLVSYNTNTSGFEPTGTSGPYDALNVGISRSSPTTGSDDDNRSMLRFVDNISPSTAFGRYAPMFTVRTFADEPIPAPPLNAGGYLVEATIEDGNFSGNTARNLNIEPIEALVMALGMRQSADGTPKEVTAETVPSGLSYHVVYARRTTPPEERGMFQVFITLDSPNHVGETSGMMRIGYSFDSWITEQISEGHIPASLGGKNDDPDSDGFTNLQEYAFATNPGRISERPARLIQGEGSEKFIRFVRHNEATDLNYVLQKSRNLADPNAWTAMPLTPEDLFTPKTTEMIEIPFPLDSENLSEFIRLGITQ